MESDAVKGLATHLEDGFDGLGEPAGLHADAISDLHGCLLLLWHSV